MNRKGNTQPGRKAQTGHAMNRQHAKDIVSGKEFFNEETGQLEYESVNRRSSRAARRNAFKVANPIATGQQNRPKGRPLHQQAKDMPKVDVDYSHNTYYIEPALTDPRGAPRCALVRSLKRPPAPARPKNLPRQAAERLDYVLTGPHRAFYKPTDRTVPEALSPVVGYIERAMVMTAVMKCYSLQDKMQTAISFVGPHVFLSCVAEALRSVVTPDAQYLIIHYTHESRPFKSNYSNISYKMCLVDKETGTFGGSYADAAPSHIVSYMAGDQGSTAHYVYSNFHRTTFIDYTCWSPTQKQGSIGRPLSEARWRTHIQHGMERIDLTTDRHTQNVVPSFQHRGQPIRSVSAVAVGTEKASCLLLGVVVLPPVEAQAWYRWPEENGKPKVGDDGSDILYLSKSFMEGYEKHRSKIDHKQKAEDHIAGFAETSKTLAQVMAEELERFDAAYALDSAPLPTNVASTESGPSGVYGTSEDESESKSEVETTPVSASLHSSPLLRPCLDVMTLPGAPLPDEPPPPSDDEDGVWITEEGRSFYVTREEMEQDLSRAPDPFEEGDEILDSEDDDDEPIHVTLPTYADITRREKPLPVLVAKVGTTSSQRNAHGRMDAVMKVPPQSQAPVPLIPAVAVHNGGSWAITRAFHSWYLKVMEYNDIHIDKNMKIGALAAISLVALRLRSPLLLLTGALTALFTDFQDLDPTLPCDTQESVSLDPEQTAYLSMLVSTAIKEGKPRTADNIARISATACRQWDGIKTTQVMGAVAREWHAQRRMLTPGFRFPLVLMVSLVVAYITTRFRIKPGDIGLASILPPKMIEHIQKTYFTDKRSFVREWLRMIIVPALGEEITKWAISAIIARTCGAPIQAVRYKVGWSFGLLEATVNPGRFRPVAGEMGEGDTMSRRLMRTIPALCVHILTSKVSLPKAIIAHTTFNTVAVGHMLGESGILRDFFDTARGMLPSTPNLAALAGLGMLPWWKSAFMVTQELQAPEPTRPPLKVTNDTIPLEGVGHPSYPIAFTTQVQPVCTQHLPLPPLRSTTTENRRRNPSIDCNPGQGYRCIGPYISTHIPFCYRSCEHNMRRALHTRMGGIPKVFQNDDSRERRLAVDAKVRKVFWDARVPLRDALKRPLQASIATIDEWLARFPNDKAQTMYNEWINHPEPRENYKCFIKKEKSVYDVEAASAVAAESDILLNFDKFDPRGISVPQPEVRVMSGPWADALNRALYNSLTHQIFYNPGNRPCDTSEWYEWALDAVRTDKLPWALAVQGDDSLFIYKKNGIIIVLCADMSRYDMSQRTSHMHTVWEVLYFLKFPRCPTGDLQEEQQRWRIYSTPWGRYVVEGTMASGDSVTITFNTFSLALAFIAWVTEGGPFDEFMATLGFSVTFKECNPFVDPLMVDFLQCRPWLAKRGNRVFGPKPGRILSRFFWIDKTFGKERRYLMELKTMVIGLWPLASHVPIINDLLLRLIVLLRDVQPAREKFYGPDELAKWFEGASEDEHSETVTEMCQLYNLQFDEIDDLRQRCREWNFDGPIDNSPALSATVSRIARVDLE